jgi:hypothetical protein
VAAYDYLSCHPGSPLAQALRTPLMAWLASVGYRDLAADPEELCHEDRFPDAEAIEDHLIDRLIPSVYPQRLIPVTGGDSHERRDPADVQRWLRFLAWHAQNIGTHEIAWWEFYRAIPCFEPVWWFLSMFLFVFFPWDCQRRDVWRRVWPGGRHPA